MRKVLFICIALLITVSACQQRKEISVPTLLEQIDTLLLRNVDSARWMFNQLTSADVQTTEDSMYMTVLQIGIERNSKYFSLMNDSQLNALIPLMRQAEAYCKDSKNARMKLRTYHYIGEILWEKERYTESVDYFIAAYEQADQIDSLEAKKTIIMQMSSRLVPSFTFDKNDRFKKILKEEDIWKEHPELEALTNRVLERIVHEPWSVQSSILYSLQHYYEAIGNKEKVLLYARRNVASREKTLKSEYTINMFLSSTHRAVGNEDSAAYYHQKADSVEKVLDKKYPNKGWRFMTEEPTEENHGMTIVWVSALIIAVGGIFFYYYKRLNEQKKELQKARQAVERLTPEADVFVKIEQIIEYHLRTAHSSLRMEKSDWNQLLAETNKRYPDIVDEWQHQYGLNEEELRIACLHLTDHPVTHLSYVMGYSRVSVYRKSKDIVRKLGGDESIALRDFLKKKVVKHV